MVQVKRKTARLFLFTGALLFLAGLTGLAAPVNADVCFFGIYFVLPSGLLALALTAVCFLVPGLVYYGMAGVNTRGSGWIPVVHFFFMLPMIPGLLVITGGSFVENFPVPGISFFNSYLLVPATAYLLMIINFFIPARDRRESKSAQLPVSPDQW